MKPHKHWGERGASDLCEVFHEKKSFFVKLEIEKLEIRIFLSLLVKAMLLALKVMLLEREVMLLDAKALPLQMEAMLL